MLSQSTTAKVMQGPAERLLGVDFEPVSAEVIRRKGGFLLMKMKRPQQPGPEVGSKVLIAFSESRLKGAAVGGRNGNARLTVEQVRAIRER